jgi:hypothetical protein
MGGHHYEVAPSFIRHPDNGVIRGIASFHEGVALDFFFQGRFRDYGQIRFCIQSLSDNFLFID